MKTLQKLVEEKGRSDQLETVIHWLAHTDDSRRPKAESIEKSEDLHPSLRNLFRTKEAPADIRHMAWGSLVWEIHRPLLAERKANDPPLLNEEREERRKDESRATFKGLKSDYQPLKLGYQSLLFVKADGGKTVRKGRIIKALEYIQDTGGDLGLATLFLAGLAEPEWFLGWLMDLWRRERPDEDAQREPRLSLVEAAKTLAKSLMPREETRTDALLRALQFFIFVCVKTVYDSDDWKQVDHKKSLFCTILRDLSDENENNYTLTPVRAAVPYLDLRRNNRSDQALSEPLWEQYSHVWLCKDAVFPLDRPKKDRRQGNHEDSSEPEVSAPNIRRQLENLQKHLDSWLTTGVRSAEDIRDDVQVRYAECMLPEVANRWHSATLGEVARHFASQVRKSELSSHLVCLVGPYGTGKTTAAQRLFIELCRNPGDSQNEGDRRKHGDPWHALHYDAASGTLRLVPLWGRDAGLRFKQCDLSRVLLQLGEKIALKLSVESVAPGARIVLNASEMNAINLVGENSGAQSGLEAVETLLREVIEKYLPEDIVVFVAAQAAYVTTELSRFFREHPDFAVARARLDRLWLLRCDCSQIEIRPPEDEDADEEDPLANLLESRLPGMPTLCAVAARRLYMPLERKYEQLRRQVTCLSADNHDIPDAIKYFCEIQSNSGDTATSDDSPLIDEWVPPVNKQGMQQAFRFGIGALATIQIALRNGFQRQFWDMVRNELSLLRAELCPKNEGEKQDASLVENLTRMQWLETLESVGAAKLGRLQDREKEDWLQGSATVEATAPAMENRDSSQGSAFEALNLGAREVNITRGHVSSGDKNNFDTAWDIIIKYVEANWNRERRCLVAVDIARKKPQQDVNHLRVKAFGKDSNDPLYEVQRENPEAPFTVRRHEGARMTTPLRLPITDLPLVVAALTLRLGTKENGIPVWSEYTDSQKRPIIRVAFDAWVEDDDSPDPSTWYVDRLLFAVSKEDSERLDAQKDAGGRCFWEKLNSVIMAFTGQKWCVPDEQERRLLAPPKEVLRALWWFERQYLDDQWKPVDLFEPENEQFKSPFYGLRPVQDGHIWRTRNLGILRRYWNEDKKRELAVTLAEYEKQEDMMLFRPRKPLFVKGKDLMRKSASGSEKIGSIIGDLDKHQHSGEEQCSNRDRNARIPGGQILLAVLIRGSEHNAGCHEVLWFEMDEG